MKTFKEQEDAVIKNINRLNNCLDKDYQIQFNTFCKQALFIKPKILEKISKLHLPSEFCDNRNYSTQELSIMLGFVSYILSTLTTKELDKFFNDAIIRDILYMQLVPMKCSYAYVANKTKYIKYSHRFKNTNHAIFTHIYRNTLFSFCCYKLFHKNAKEMK